LRIVRGMCVPFKLTTNLTQAQRSAHSGGSWVSYFKMKSLNKAVNEYLHALTIPATKPRIVWHNNSYVVMWYYSDKTINLIGGEIVK
jgi:hypothetical protein